jgi:hypothetical protein
LAAAERRPFRFSEIIFMRGAYPLSGRIRLLNG